jgi:carbonic anhydrase
MRPRCFLRAPLVGALLFASHLASTALIAQTPVSAEDALARLTAGNNRFVAGEATHPDQSVDRRQALEKGQAPFAIVLTCADSRVAPELYFDQGLGSLFVIRNAGNVIDDHVIGSIEYAVEHLHARLIVVVGHEKCGAVAATVAGGHAPGHIHSIVESIEPALESVKDKDGDKVDLTVRANAKRVAEILGRVEPIVAAAVKSGEVKVVAARYALGTGKVEILP